MNKIVKIIGIVFVAVGFYSCAQLTTEKTADVNQYIEENTKSGGALSSKYYVESMSFTGDLTNDFGTERLAYSESTNDSTSSIGRATLTYHELYKLYFAVDMDNIYIGFKSPVYPTADGENSLYSGASYIYIDNGITNTTNSYSSGLKVFNNTGKSSAGLGGDTIGSFDETGITVSGSHKISLMIKHYRPSAKDVQIYTCVNNLIKNYVLTLSGSSVSWLNYTKDGVSEFQIPIVDLFGQGMVATNIPAFYVALRIDDALTADALGESSDPNAVAIDWMPNQTKDISSTNYYGKYLNKWVKISVTNSLVILDVPKPTISITTPVSVTSATTNTTNVTSLTFGGSFNLSDDYSEYHLELVENGYAYSCGVGSGSWILYNQVLPKITNNIYARIVALNGTVWVTNTSPVLTVITN